MIKERILFPWLDTWRISINNSSQSIGRSHNNKRWNRTEIPLKPITLFITLIRFLYNTLCRNIENLISLKNTYSKQRVSKKRGEWIIESRNRSIRRQISTMKHVWIEYWSDRHPVEFTNTNKTWGRWQAPVL